jgi:hypothetical protein
MNLIKRSKEGIKQQIRAGEEAKMEFGKLLGGKVKIQHHRDYYLNTITDHYTTDQFGMNRRFSHRTETGYVFQRRETKTDEKELPAEAKKQIAEAMKAKDKQLEFLRLSLKLLDKIEETLKAQIDATVAESGSADDAVVDVHTLRSALKADDPKSLDRLLLAPRVYEALSSHNVALNSVLSFLKGDENIGKIFAEQRTAPVIAPPKIARRPSFSDLSHISNVKSKANGLSFESVASNLTLWRYEMERLAAANPEAYDALMNAWDTRVKATMAVGAIDALAVAPETGGTSLLAYGVSLGAGLGLDYLADLVAKHGAEKAAALASGGDPKLYASYQKTFNFVGTLVAQHGIRAGLKKVSTSSSSSSSTSSSSTSKPVSVAETTGKTGLHPMVKPVGVKMPINAAYAGKTMSVQEVGQRLTTYYEKRDVKDFRNPYQHGIPFTAQGFPDFSRYAIRRVKIAVTGNHQTDSKLADKVAGFIGTNRRPEGYTWHHHYDCETMELIPTDLNSAIGHTGGAAIVKSSIK